MQPGDWVVHIHTRKVARFEALAKAGALVTPAQTQRYTVWHPRHLVRIGTKDAFDFDGAWELEDELDTLEIDREWGITERTTKRNDLDADLKELLTNKELIGIGN